MNIEAFFKITYGLYIVTSIDRDKATGHISNTFFQVTAEPARFAVCSNKDNLTTEFIKKSKVFTVSVIQQDVDLNYIGNFGFKSGKDVDKFKDVNFRTGKNGAPIVLDKTIAFFECEVVETIDVGTHIMFIGSLLEADLIDNDSEPLTYSYYRHVIKGKSPKNAPTYIDKDKLSELENKKIDSKMNKYVCQVCGYVYDPAEGDPSEGIPPGTPFEELPEDWVCPVCGVGKDMFEEED